MKEFCVTYGTILPHPSARFAFYAANPRTIVVEAGSKVDAYVAAFNHLTRRGHRIGMIDHQWPVTKEELASAMKCGVPSSAGDHGAIGATIIMEVAPYAISTTARVIE